MNLFLNPPFYSTALCIISMTLFDFCSHYNKGWKLVRKDSSVQFSSVTQSCPTLCNPMDCSTPGFPVYHQLPELAQTHVHWVSDATQPSHPLSPTFPPAFDLSSGSFLMSQLFESGDQSIGASASASVLPVNFKGLFPLRLTSLISFQSNGLSRVFSSTTFWKHQFFNTWSSL